MKCPNCGEEMAEDRLYCEHCGEDIHIVPDFEPELERNLEQSISAIMEDLQEPSCSRREGWRLQLHRKSRHRPKMRRRSIPPGGSHSPVKLRQILLGGSSPFQTRRPKGHFQERHCHVEKRARQLLWESRLPVKGDRFAGKTFFRKYFWV